MGKWVLVNEVNCADPAKEEEFINWYENMHFPDVLQTPGFVKATRYELTTPPPEGKGKYLLIYEIETDDLDSMMAVHGKNMERCVKASRIRTDLLDRKSRGIYKQVYCLESNNTKKSENKK
jgi:hypothetical protein